MGIASRTVYKSVRCSVDREEFRYYINIHGTVSYVVREVGGRKLGTFKTQREAVEFAQRYTAEFD